MNEIEILNKVLGGIAIKDMTGLTFLQWVAKKLNGLSAYNKDTVELTAQVQFPPYGKMSDQQKIDIIRKLEKLNIPIE